MLHHSCELGLICLREVFEVVFGKLLDFGNGKKGVFGVQNHTRGFS